MSPKFASPEGLERVKRSLSRLEDMYHIDSETLSDLSQLSQWFEKSVSRYQTLPASSLHMDDVLSIFSLDPSGNSLVLNDCDKRQIPESLGELCSYCGFA